MNEIIPSNTFEQTPSQKETLSFCVGKINQRLRELGLEERNYDITLVQYIPDLNLTTDQYESESDRTRLWLGSEVNIRLYFHELTHAFASERRYMSEDNLEIGNIKSGFHLGTTFKVLNEAMTEKIARELYEESYDESTKYIRSLFPKDRLMEVMRIIQERHTEIIDVITAEQLQIYKDEVRKCRIKHKCRISFIKYSDLSKERKKRVLNFTIEDYLWKQKSLRNNFHPTGATQQMIRDRKIGSTIEMKQKALEESYYDSPKSNSYEEYVNIMNIIIDCLCLSKKTDKREEWNTLQKAYFTGNNLCLETISHVFQEYNIDIFRELDKFGGLDDSIKLNELTQKLLQVKIKLMN